MKINYKEDLTGAVKFYWINKNQGLREDSFGKAVRRKRGLPAVRSVYAEQKRYLHLLPESYQFFYKRFTEIYIVPLEDFIGNIYGFLFKAVEDKAYRVLSSSIVLFYGWQDFKGFGRGMPILLTEGIKDAEALKAFDYPYVLGLLHGFPSRNQMEVLTRLTNRLYYIGDKDYTGMKSAEILRRRRITTFIPPLKDVGKYFEDLNSTDRMMIEAFLKGVVESLWYSKF